MIAAIKQHQRLCWILGEAALVATGVCSHGIIMIMGGEVGISGRGGVEGPRGSGKGERNGRQRDDHR